MLLRDTTYIHYKYLARVPEPLESISILLGAIFWDVAGDSNLYLRDRVGFHYTSLGIFFWPLSIIAICEVADCRPNVERDIKDGLYGRFIYILMEVSLDTIAQLYESLLGVNLPFTFSSFAECYHGA